MRVHQRLNAGRAITLCWTANRPSKREIDRQRLDDRPLRKAVEGGRGPEPADEPDRVKKDAQKYAVTDDPEQERSRSGL